MVTRIAPEGDVTVASLLDRVGPWTVDDLEIFDEHERVEIDNGTLIVAPHPTVPHNTAVFELLVALRSACPSDLAVGPENGVAFRASFRRPDGVVFHRDAGRKRRLDPDDIVMAIEVVSPSSRRIDARDKVEDYASIGIAHYWILELEPEPMLIAYALRADAYVEIARVVGDETYEATEPFPVSITPSALVA